MIAPPTQIFGGTRFYEAPPWRVIVGDLEDNTLTFLDKLALDRSVTVTRAAARVISGRVPSDNPEVNIPAPDPDGEAFLSEGTRIVSCFRREAPGGSAPGLVLKSDNSVAQAYVNLLFDTPTAEVWITCRMAYSAAALAWFDANNSFYLVWVGTYLGTNDAAAFISSGPFVTLATGGGAQDFPAAPTADAWHDWELHYMDDGTTEVYLDGVLSSTHTSSNADAPPSFALGQYAGGGAPNPDADSIVYFDDVKAGTTRGGDDLFSDDFEDGTLDAWTHVVGSCTVVEDPFATSSAQPPWVIRARGLVLSLEDDADTDHATSTFTAYDPWKYLYRRPMFNLDSEVGDISYVAGTRANEIIIEQLQLAIDAAGTIYTDFGQTAFYAGTIENTEPLPDDGDGLAMTFRAGTTLGEMLDLLVATGTCDVVFDPIYDVENRPGLLCEMSIYSVAGAFKPNAVMGWDRWPRSLVGLSRQVEGTERANNVQMYAGQGGPPVPLEVDAASVSRFGEYWALQYLPGVPSLAGAHTIAQRQLALLKDGQYTYALSPASERAPLLFEEYREADTVPVYASDRFRDPISGVPVRVESIPIVIGDDSLERVNQMLVSFAPESGS